MTNPDALTPLPPAINPDAKAKSSDTMKAEGEQESETLQDRGTSDAHETQLSNKLARRQQRDGAGEQKLDPMKPETLLPPGMTRHAWWFPLDCASRADLCLVRIVMRASAQ